VVEKERSKLADQQKALEQLQAQKARIERL